MKCCFISQANCGDFEDYYDKFEDVLNLIESCGVDELILSNSNEYEYNLLLHINRVNEDEEEDTYDFDIFERSFNANNNFNNLIHNFKLIDEADVCIIHKLKKLNKEKNEFLQACIALSIALKKQYFVVD